MSSKKRMRAYSWYRDDYAFVGDVEVELKKRNGTEVEITGVPDVDHVNVKFDDGYETTVCDDELIPV